MSLPNRLLRSLCLVACLGLLGCGGKSSGYVPVDSPLMPFEPPAADEISGTDSDWSSDEDETEDAGE